jgi:hypothetical protein
LLNTIYWLKYKAKLLFLLYEILAGLLLLTIMCAYWLPTLRQTLNWTSVLAFLAVLCFDFYFTIWGKQEDIGLVTPKVTHEELEISKAISILLAAPAYITGLLLIFEIIKK